MGYSNNSGRRLLPILRGQRSLVVQFHLSMEIVKVVSATLFVISISQEDHTTAISTILCAMAIFVTTFLVRWDGMILKKITGDI